MACAVLGFISWLAYDIYKENKYEQLISGAGYIVFMFMLWLVSKYPTKVEIILYENAGRFSIF